MSSFDKFLIKFAKSFKDADPAIHNVMNNVFSMRIIGNKTHGDLAEVALTEYINKFVKGYTARHTGKEKFRAKKYEEDISVTDEATKETIPISIKAYGEGPLQLSTNKDGSMFRYLKENIGNNEITNQKEIQKILNYPSFKDLDRIYILPLIYKEIKESDGGVKGGNFKIIIFNIAKAYKFIGKIKYVIPGKRGRKHPIYIFLDESDKYIFEVRYGDAGANALQRGIWTQTERAKYFFNEILSGSYLINQSLINLISKVLVSPEKAHKEILRTFYRA